MCSTFFSFCRRSEYSKEAYRRQLLIMLCTLWAPRLKQWPSFVLLSSQVEQNMEKVLLTGQWKCNEHVFLWPQMKHVICSNRPQVHMFCIYSETGFQFLQITRPVLRVGGFLCLKFERGFKYSSNNGAIETQRGFGTDWTRREYTSPTYVNSHTARPALIIIQPQTMGFRVEFHGVRTGLELVVWRVWAFNGIWLDMI